ncbi:MAG: hypothetical protein Q4C71_02595 [Microbacteriaceae bacterium]|nr:hypothetical protein [Microbacteriaceae bacterium]
MNMNVQIKFKAFTNELIDYYQSAIGDDLSYMHETCEYDGYDDIYNAVLHGLANDNLPLPRKTWLQCKEFAAYDETGEEEQLLYKIPILNDIRLVA